MKLGQFFTGPRRRRPSLGYRARDDRLELGVPRIQRASCSEPSMVSRLQDARIGTLRVLELFDDLPPRLVPAKDGDPQTGREFIIFGDGLNNVAILRRRPYVSAAVSSGAGVGKTG